MLHDLLLMHLPRCMNMVNLGSHTRDCHWFLLLA